LKFDLEKSILILERTPAVLEQLLRGLPDDWVMHNEGGDTWSPYDIMGHLIHGERTDWMTRAKMILDGQHKTFPVFDRTAMFEESKGKSLADLLAEFKSVRAENLKTLRSLNLSGKDFDKTGMHPRFGKVTLSQLLSTWTIHDLTHLAQISRVMAKQYKEEIGPWLEFFRIVQD
jgi:hypothetical protein